MISNNRISDLISTQLPSFISEDYPTFVAFIEAYYEFLEQSGQLNDISNNMLDYYDIDKTLDTFATHLYNEFIEAIPANIVADKKVVMKYIKDFYRAKGTEKAYKFLLRILFNDEATIYYPRKDILKTDDGKWYIQKSLRLNDWNVDGVANTNLTGLQLLVSKRVVGNTSNASATIERIDRYYEYGQQINEIVLSNILGSFESGEVITANINANSVNTVTANILSSGILSLSIINGGSGYSIGDPLIFESSSGSGASAFISSVSQGNISNISIVYSGAGFLSGDPILITGSGSGASAEVDLVDEGETYHPNTYIGYSTTLSALANTTIDAADYANLNHDIVSSPNIDSIMSETLNTFSYGPCGPIQTIDITSDGSGYTSVPNFSVYSNTAIVAMGILGRMEIYDGGSAYSNSDTLIFNNITLGGGVGAAGNVVVDGSGTIVRVNFTEVSGFPIGGMGYNQTYLPTVEVQTSTGSGANIAVTSIIGDGESLTGGTGGTGGITGITITNRGIGYLEAPTINLTQSGTGTAQVSANIISGVFSYPGRYLNDDGFLDSYNFLADRDYYQPYSYVVKSATALDKYRQVVNNLLHPSGTKLFGKVLTYSNIYTDSGFIPTANADDEIVSSGIFTRAGDGIRDRSGAIIEG